MGQTPDRLGVGMVAGLAGVGALLAAGARAEGQENMHFTYLWHMEQPVYWPDRQVTSAGLGDRYERLAESLARGGVHPQNNLSEIFGLDDRVAAYRFRMRDAIASMAFPGSGGGTYPEGGAQISYSGGLIENLQSVGGTGRIGGRYESDWYRWIREARGGRRSTARRTRGRTWWCLRSIMR